jgi:hypothetical protein
MGEERKVYRVSVGKPEGKGPLERLRHRWKDGIRMDLRETGWGGCGGDLSGSGQGPVVGFCECSDEPLGSGTVKLVNPALVSCNPSHYNKRFHHLWASYFS